MNTKSLHLVFLVVKFLYFKKMIVHEVEIKMTTFNFSLCEIIFQMKLQDA